MGEKAPDLRLDRLEGGEVSLAELTANGPVVLVFFKVSCPVCQLTFPFLDRIHASGGLPVYGISQNDARDTREFSRRFRLAFPMLLDDEAKGFPVSNAYGVSSVPTWFLVEPGGTVARAVEGWRKAEVAKLGAMAGVQPFLQEDRNLPEWKAG